VGISKLQLVNPNIKMSEEILGSACNVGRCGVRLVNKEKLEYHRSKCHDNQEFICPECKNVRVTGVWSKVLATNPSELFCKTCDMLLFDCRLLCICGENTK